MLKIDDKHYFIKTVKFNKNAFLKYLGITKKTYMDRTMTKLFEYRYANAISLKNEYKKYYKKEFATFCNFLRQKHNLHPSEIDIFCNKRSFYKDLSIAPDLNVPELMNDEVIASAVTSFEEEMGK